MCQQFCTILFPVLPLVSIQRIREVGPLAALVALDLEKRWHRSVQYFTLPSVVFGGFPRVSMTVWKQYRLRPEVAAAADV